MRALLLGAGVGRWSAVFSDVFVIPLARAGVAEGLGGGVGGGGPFVVVV